VGYNARGLRDMQNYIPQYCAAILFIKNVIIQKPMLPMDCSISKNVLGINIHC
jgi:hypothetical protein